MLRNSTIDIINKIQIKIKPYFPFIILGTFKRLTKHSADEVWAVPKLPSVGGSVHRIAVGNGSLIIGGNFLIGINFDPDGFF